MTQPTVSKHWRKIGPRIRLQSYQVHPTVLTIIQQLCSMKQKYTKYTQINTNESMQSEVGPVWQNPIQRTVRTADLSVSNSNGVKQAKLNGDLLYLVKQNPRWLTAFVRCRHWAIAICPPLIVVTFSSSSHTLPLSLSCLPHGWSCRTSDTRPWDYILSLIDDVVDAALVVAAAKETDCSCHHSASRSGQILANRYVAEFQSYAFYLAITCIN